MRQAWAVGLLALLAQTGCATGASIAIATEVEDWTIDVEQVRAARIDRGWKVDLRWIDGHEAELEWTPMAVLDQGNVQRTRPLVVPRVSDWFGEDRVLNGIYHSNRALLLYKDGVQTAEYPIRRTEPIRPGVKYAVLAGLIPFTVAWDLATLPLQALGVGVVAIVIAVLDDEELSGP